MKNKYFESIEETLNRKNLDINLYFYRVRMEFFEEKHCYDGDTVWLYIDLGLYTYMKERIRLYGINAPELKGEERHKGLASRAYLRALLKDAKENNKKVYIRTIKDRKGKYGRYLGIIFIDGENINEKMVNEGYAEFKEY